MGDALAATEVALHEWGYWESEHLEVGAAMRATDDALLALNSALEKELDALAKCSPQAVLHSGRDKAKKIIKAAKCFVSGLHSEAGNSEMTHTESLLADCNSLASELKAIEISRNKAREVQNELRDVMGGHLKASEQVIRNHAEVELLRLHASAGKHVQR